MTGDKLKSTRLEAGLTLEQLAAMTKLSAAALSLHESGKRHEWLASNELAVRLALRKAINAKRRAEQRKAA